MRGGSCLTITLTLLLWWCVRGGGGAWSSSKLRKLHSEPPPAVRNASETEVCTNLDIRNSVKQFKKLQNCAVVEGFVQILLIDNAVAKDFENISFPKLQEITGYLLLYRVQGLPSLSKIFPNLVVIRGDVLFHNYALVIYELRAMLEVGLSNLTTILRGSVRIEKNTHLCYVDTIDWDRIAKAGRGGHLVKRNKPREQCPDTCPSGCPIITLPSGRQQKLCWNSHTCQRVCSLGCEHQNVTCSINNTCCHKECLGGCIGDHSHQCIACRHVIYQGRCMESCPIGTYKYLDRRCLEEDKCKSIKNRLSIMPVTQEVHWKPFHRECLPQCPSGYAENNRNKHQCLKCEGQCPKVCEGAVIDSVSNAQKLKGCTLVNGSLEIQIQGGDHIIRELENSLSSIREIRGYLKIARSFPLVSLNFLRDLEIIGGQQLDKKDYALLVLDNQNLQELWNWESRTTKLNISNGKVFFHFNSKLCLNKINELKKYAYVQKWEDTDVSPSSNGDRVACNVINLEIQLWGLRSEVAGLKWRNFRKSHSDIDFRSLLGYVVYHREAPDQNVTIFDGRDACGADEWKVNDVEADEDSEYVLTLLTHLKPFTTYAAYMRTYTIASASMGAQSPIIYFTTKPNTPSLPVNAQAVAPALGEIIVTWGSPKKPNGNVTHYIINGIREKDSSDFISQRNYCIEPLILPDLKLMTHADKPLDHEDFDLRDGKSKSKKWKSQECCSCSKNKPPPDEEDDVEFQIHFEDFLHNSVYIKNPNADKVKFPVPKLPKALTTVATGQYFSTNSINDTVTEAMGNYVSMQSTIDVPLKNDSDDNITEKPTPDGEEGKFHYEVYNDLFVVIKNLRHFTEYTIEVQACQDPSSEDYKIEECSAPAITTVRTLPLGGADDINLSSITIMTENLTAGVLYVKWDEPLNYNGLIVSYHIEIKPAEANDYQPIPVCITQLEYLKKNGYILYDLMPGNFSLRLRATSLAGNGNWTSPLYFVRPEARTALRSEFIALLVIALIIVACSCVGVPLYFYYRKKYGNDIPGMLYASVNPEYMSAVYEPDEWEVPREKIALRQELGQGSFGMVYKGEFKKEDGSILKCAVKTVNESASLRERIEFLQEASVMKAFNCHHVVKLLGVVSKGHPTLVIMELMGKGDLKAYLRSRRPDCEENIDYPNAQPPTLKEILQMAVEIADGMAYLAAKKFVHRDLAARNCMVSDDLTVKIGDFGMTRDIYETDYYRKGGKGLLPVRWMAPECLKDGLFSSQSDIWSYGVVLWEMATLASQPYQGLANEQVLQFVISGGRMTKPENCPEKLYAIMDLCWDKNPKARPTFNELIDMLLPDVEKSRFREVSFYFSQRLENAAKESELSESATASTPMRTQWMDSTVHREDSDTESEVIYFPQTRNSVHRNYKEAGRGEPPPVEGSKGMSLTSSDDSKGSKVSSASNGSVVNGHIPHGRTTMC